MEIRYEIVQGKDRSVVRFVVVFWPNILDIPPAAAVSFSLHVIRVQCTLTHSFQTHHAAAAAHIDPIERL